MGYEKFVMDLDRCGMMCTMLAGLTIDTNQLAHDAYRQAGSDQHFLGTDHTLANFETANYASNVLSDTQSLEQWREGGSLDTSDRAVAVWKKMLAEYELPFIDAAVDEALRDFMRKTKAASPDAWY